jgi:hypothetical protein
MSKVTGPLFSLQASKVFGKTIEYRASKGQNIVSMKHKPGSKQPFTLGEYQINAKIYTADAVDHWHQLSLYQRSLWNDFVRES